MHLGWLIWDVIRPIGIIGPWCNIRSSIVASSSLLKKVWFGSGILFHNYLGFLLLESKLCYLRTHIFQHCLNIDLEFFIRYLTLLWTICFKFLLLYKLVLLLKILKLTFDKVLVFCFLVHRYCKWIICWDT